MLRELSLGPHDRQRLEELWSSRLAQAKLSFDSAVAECRVAGAEYEAKHLPAPDGSLAFAVALRAESAARLEYTRVLQIFNDLVVHHKVPEESPRADRI